MGELKTKPHDGDVDAFLASVEDEDRRADCRKVLALMKRVTKEKPRMWGTSIVGFGSYHYKYASGQEGDWLLTGFSPRKRELTLYITPGFTEFAPLMEKLGKHKTGKSCLYIKRFSDVDPDVLEELVRASVAHQKEHVRSRSAK